MSALYTKKIKKAYIIHRSYSEEAKKKSKEVSLFLKTQKISSQILSQKEVLNKTAQTGELIVAIGGDGTYLKAAHFGKKKNLPVLGFNMGSLGFLTPHHNKKAISILEKTLDGKMNLKKQFFIEAKIYKSSPYKLIDTFQAINDVVIERGSLSHLIPISIFINKKYIYSMKSDGLIIASPLGSTAYNLAAGGPILHPEVNSFVITPICSHSLTDRPLIIHDKSEIILKIDEKKAFLTLDGIQKKTLLPSHTLVIKKDKKFFFSLTEKKDKEFDLLRDKLKFGQRD